MHLTYNNIILRPWQPGDLGSLVKHAGNFNVWINLRDAFPHPYTEEAGRAWLEMAQKEDKNLLLAIEVDGEAVGGIGAHFHEDVYRINAEIGYWLSEVYWGKGITTISVNLLVDHVFRIYPVITRIYADVFAHNPASGRVLQKCGFHLEAVHRKAVIKNGVITDEHRYVRLKEG